MLILSSGGLQILQIRPNAHSLNNYLRQLSLLIYVILLVFTVFYHKFVYYCTKMISLPSLRGEMIPQAGLLPDALPSGISFIK